MNGTEAHSTVLAPDSRIAVSVMNNAKNNFNKINYLRKQRRFFMKILGIETSCDETAIAIYDSEQGLQSHVVYSQIDIHAMYGGVVPELAARDHVRKVLPLLKEAMAKAQCTSSDITAIAYTAGPGLVGALMVGAAFAKSLAFAWQIPAVAVHHMEAHLLAPFLEKKSPEFPFVALLISGGHTLLVLVTDLGKYQILGQSLDDAAGEAFDKVAKILDLPYPGGKVLAELAEEGDIKRFHFPRPMVNRQGLDFSFSGLKTYAANTLKKQGKEARADIASAFQAAVVDTFIIKCKRALEQTGLARLVIAGGVSANKMLRERLEKMGKDLNVEIYYPRIEFCTDNAAMVAYAGYRRFMLGDIDCDLKLNVHPRWELG